jgi:opacity protein-like surface antigen
MSVPLIMNSLFIIQDITMKIVFLFTLAFISLFSFGQPLHVDVFGGNTGYWGDLKESALSTNLSNYAIGAGITYDLTNKISIRSGITLGKTGADDKKNKQPDINARNLNFRTAVQEGNLLVEYHFFDFQRQHFTPYIFGGLAVFHFNPYSHDTAGNKIMLHPLSTEGEGIAGTGRSAYHLTQLAVPLGAGIKWRLSENISIGYEIGLRKMFTDYFDDVSTTYIDQSLLLASKGTKAVEMAYRGGELKTGSQQYPTAGSIRGNPKLKDWYDFQGIRLSFGLDKIKRGRTDCPPGVL